jgi:hypothetical protein
MTSGMISTSMASLLRARVQNYNYALDGIGERT